MSTCLYIELHIQNEGNKRVIPNTAIFLINCLVFTLFLYKTIQILDYLTDTIEGEINQIFTQLLTAAPQVTLDRPHQEEEQTSGSFRCLS